MRLVVDVSDEEVRRMKQLQSRSMAVGTGQRIMVEVMERALLKLEERAFVAVDTYCEEP